MAFFLFGAVGLIWVAAWRWWFRDKPTETPGISEAELRLIGETTPTQHKSLPWRSVLKNRSFQKLLLMYHLYCWGGYFYLSWLHTYLQSGRGLSENDMKVASSLPALAGFAGVIVGGFLSDRLMRRFSLRIARCSIGAVSLSVSGLCLLAATMTANNWNAVALLSIGLGIMNAMLPVAWSLCVDLGGEHSGAVSGAMNMAGQLGSFISSVAFGYLIEWLGSYDLALMPLAAMLVLGGVVFATIDPVQRLIPDSEPARAAA